MVNLKDLCFWYWDNHPEIKEMNENEELKLTYFLFFASLMYYADTGKILMKDAKFIKSGKHIDVVMI